MIQLFAKQSKAGVPVVMLGLTPENMVRIQLGDPVFVKLRDISPDCPDYTVSIGANSHVQPKAIDQQKKHISINFAGDFLARFIQRRLIDLPLQAVGGTAPQFSLVLFYTQDEETFMAEIAGSVKIDDFRDLRGGAN